MKKVIVAIMMIVIGMNASAALTISWDYAANLVDWDASVQTGWLVQMYQDVNGDSSLGSLAFDTTAADGTFTVSGNGSDDVLLGSPLIGTTAGAAGLYVAFSYATVDASAAENSDVYTVLFNASSIGAATQGVILDSSTKSLGTGVGTYAISSVDGSWQAVPEPATAMLLALGGGLAWLVRLKHRMA